MKCTGIILAAGASRRMGLPKHRVMIKGRTFLQHIIEAMRGSGIEDIIVVFRPGDAIAGDYDSVVNPTPELGQLSSFKTALKRLPANSYFLMHLVDRPLVKTSTFKLLIEQAEPGMVLIPVYRGRKGHPVLFPPSFPEIVLNTGDSSTIREIIRGHQHIVRQIDVDDEGILINIDTVEELAKWR